MRIDSSSSSATRRGMESFRKYSACRIGDRIVPLHIMFGRQWMVKSVEPEHEAALSDAERRAEIEEERRYVEENAHEEPLREVFRLARIEYGRIDYAVGADAGIQVWEINTNPFIMGRTARREGREAINASCAKQLESAFRAVNTESSQRRIPNPLRRRYAARALPHTAKLAARTLLGVAGLTDQEPALRRGYRVIRGLVRPPNRPVTGDSIT